MDNITEKKLANLRKILWLCFGILSLAPLAGCIATYFVTNTRFIGELIIPTILLLMTIGCLGALCWGVYYFAKKHLEKEESNIFL